MMAGEDPGPEWDVAPYLRYGSFLDVLRRSLKPRTDVENTGAASGGGLPMRRVGPGSAPPPTGEDGTGDRLRDALDRNRELLAIIGALPGATYRYLRRA